MALPTELEWHKTPELPPWTGEEIAVLTWHEASGSYEVAQFNWKPDAGFLIGVDAWALLSL